MPLPPPPPSNPIDGINIRDAEMRLVNIHERWDKKPLLLPAGLPTPLHPHQIDAARFILHALTVTVDPEYRGAHGRRQCILSNGWDNDKIAAVCLLFRLLRHQLRNRTRFPRFLVLSSDTASWQSGVADWCNMSHMTFCEKVPATWQSGLGPDWCNMSFFKKEDVIPQWTGTNIARWKEEGGVIMLSLDEYGRAYKRRVESNRPGGVCDPSCTPDLLVVDSALEMFRSKQPVEEALADNACDRWIVIANRESLNDDAMHRLMRLLWRPDPHMVRESIKVKSYGLREHPLVGTFRCQVVLNHCPYRPEPVVDMRATMFRLADRMDPEIFDFYINLDSAQRRAGYRVLQRQ